MAYKFFDVLTKKAEQLGSNGLKLSVSEDGKNFKVVFDRERLQVETEYTNRKGIKTSRKWYLKREDNPEEKTNSNHRKTAVLYFKKAVKAAKKKGLKFKPFNGVVKVYARKEKITDEEAIEDLMEL